MSSDLTPASYSNSENEILLGVQGKRLKISYLGSTKFQYLLVLDTIVKLTLKIMAVVAIVQIKEKKL